MSDAEPGPTVLNITGTPDKPDLKRRPLGFVLALAGYAAFMAALIVWAIQLHRR